MFAQQLSDQGLVTSAGDPLFAALRTAGTQVRLSSPYLSRSVADELRAVRLGSPARWRLLSRLDPVAVAHGSLSVSGLRLLLDVGVEIRHLPALHAKVFLCDEAFGLVGSANLTVRGLSSFSAGNVELAVRLNASQCSAAGVSYDEWWEAAEGVDGPRLERLEATARQLPPGFRWPAEPGSGAPSTLALRASRLLLDAPSRNLWVKAQYWDAAVADSPFRGWFSSSKKGKPSFASGDLVLIYARDTGRCNVVVEVLAPARHDPGFLVGRGVPPEDAERWPWVNDAHPKLHVPVAAGVTLSELGVKAQGLQSGHIRLGLSEFAAAVRALGAAPASLAPTP